MKSTSIYREYAGIVATDVTVTADMDFEWQAATMLLNQLFMATVAINGVKVAPNLRSGGRETLRFLKTIPPDVICASGTLGCDDLRSPADFTYLEKVLTVRPRGVLVYGKRDDLMLRQLSRMGIDYRVYVDSHRRKK